MSELNAASSACHPRCATPAELVPVRVDATTQDGHVRIVDTLLLDPRCLPVPRGGDTVYEWVEANVRCLANSVISDAEVTGMGRTVRHFTNRIDLWSPELQELVEEQIRAQLWRVLDKRGQERKKNSTVIKISLRLTIQNVLVNDDFEWDTGVPTCPIAVAKRLTEELNLPGEATVAIATSIVEQLNNVPISPGKASVATSAHLLDTKDLVNNLAHAVTLYRPSQLDGSIN